MAALIVISSEGSKISDTEKLQFNSNEIKVARPHFDYVCSNLLFCYRSVDVHRHLKVFSLRLLFCILCPSLSLSHSPSTFSSSASEGGSASFVAGSSVAVGMVFDPLGGLYVYCSNSLLKVMHTLM